MQKPASLISACATASRRVTLLTCAAAVVIAALFGLATAQAADKKSKDDDSTKEPRTIGDVAGVDGLDWFTVRGVGLVVNLDSTGSDPAPGPERSELLSEMQKRGVKGAEELLRSPGTALVRVRARIPPAVRSCKSAGCWCKSNLKSKRSETEPALRPHKGDSFDVEVEVPERDTTKSLQGGWLLESWLYEIATLHGAGEMKGHVRARAEGPVLATGGLDPDNAKPTELRRGRVLGGGIANEDRDFYLQTQGDRTARWTRQIAARVNERFPARTRDGKLVADAKNGQQISLKIPARYRHNIARYLEVIRFMPITQNGEEEAERMSRWGEELLRPPTARVSALRLEGVGSRAVDTIKQGLKSADPDVQFFAAESLAYLGESAGAHVLGDTARRISEYRAHALAAFVALDEPVCRIELSKLMSESDSVELRYGAFRAFRAMDPDEPDLAGVNVDDRLFLHVVPSTGAPLVHVTSRERPEIVIFGNNVQLETPLLLWAGKRIMLNASTNSPNLVMSRFMSGQDTRLGSSLQVADVIQNTVRLGANYSEVISMLVQADKQDSLPGRLELDTLPDPNRMIARLRKLSNQPDKATESAAMPNLLGWSDDDKATKRGRPTQRNEKTASAEKDSDTTEPERKYITKPSWIDRLFRRSAN